MTEATLFEQEVLPLFEATRQHWLERARHTATYLCHKHGTATIDDVRDICPPPEDVDPRVMGAVFKRTEFECIGHRRSVRKTCHGRPIGVFRLRG